MNHQHAAAVDTKIAATYSAWVAAADAAENTLMTLVHSAVGNHDGVVVRRTNNKATYRTYIYIDGQLEGLTFNNIAPYLSEEKNAQANAAKAAVVAAKAAYEAAEEEYAGWSRFFLVPAGHIHSSMDCSSCNRGRNATMFSWLPELSGLTEADAVAAHGAHLCTVCFPSAPVEWQHKK